MRRSVRTEDFSISLAAILQGINSIVDSGSDLPMVPSDAEYVCRALKYTRGHSVRFPICSIVHRAASQVYTLHVGEWSEYEFGKLLGDDQNCSGMTLY
jgi:hypothetical protein